MKHLGDIKRRAKRLATAAEELRAATYEFELAAENAKEYDAARIASNCEGRLNDAATALQHVVEMIENRIKR